MSILTQQQRVLIEEILQAYIPHCRVIAFGSRVSGDTKPFSDLDLAVYSSPPLSLVNVGMLKEAFSESNLPFRVDVVDMNTVSDEFRRVIENQYETIQSKNASTL